MEVVVGNLFQTTAQLEIFTDKMKLFEHFREKYPYLPYPQNFEFMTTYQLYDFLHKHDIYDNFALFNVKVLKDMNVPTDYTFSCYLQILKLIQKFERIYNRKFRTMDVSDVMKEIDNELNSGRNLYHFDDEFLEHLRHDKSSNEELSYIELMALFYISFYISLMITGKVQQSDIDSRRDNDIPCLTPTEAKNTRFQNMYLINSVHHIIRKNKVFITYIDNMMNLLQLINTKFDIYDTENQHLLYVCNLLIKKLTVGLKHMKNRTAMLKISDELVKYAN
jgi:hypothetical protein